MILSVYDSSTTSHFSYLILSLCDGGRVYTHSTEPTVTFEEKARTSEPLCYKVFFCDFYNYYYYILEVYCSINTMTNRISVLD